MRLSGLVIAAVLFISILFISPALGQHSSGGGASSAGASHSSYAGGSSSVGASHASSVSSSRSVSSSSQSSQSSSSQRARSVNGPSNGSAKKAPDHSLASFFHHKKPEPTPTPVTQRMFIPRCRRGENCGVCPGGSRNGFGQCVYPTQGCVTGQVWNGLGCGSPYYLSSCRNLAAQLASMDRWQNQNDPSWAWRRQLLLQQYQQCTMRYGGNPFSLYALDGLSPFDAP
jgi:hypothetical protein